MVETPLVGEFRHGEVGTELPNNLLISFQYSRIKQEPVDRKPFWGPVLEPQRNANPCGGWQPGLGLVGGRGYPAYR